MAEPLVVEVAICTQDYPGNRAKAGDIAVIRAPGLGIGRKEMHERLWLRLSGVPAAIRHRLRSNLEDTIMLPGQRPRRLAKRRYRIPFARLNALVIGFDESRARDRNDFYQPFYVINSNNLMFISADSPMPALFLVEDKVTGELIRG